MNRPSTEEQQKFYDRLWAERSRKLNSWEVQRLSRVLVGIATLFQTMIEAAWLWVRHQPDSALTQWFDHRTQGEKGRIRRVMIVALARSLLPKAVEHWSLTTLRETLIKIGTKVVRHGRYITFQLAEVAIPRSLFANILRLIDGLRPAPLPP